MSRFVKEFALVKEAFIMGGNDGIGAKYAGVWGWAAAGGLKYSMLMVLALFCVLYH